MELVIVVVIVIGAVAAVLLPLVRRNAGERLDRPGAAPPDDAALEREITAVRDALRTGTLCGRCGTANPTGSNYCAECGRRLNGQAA